MLIKQFKEIEKLFSKLVKDVVYGDDIFVVLESIHFDFDDLQLITIKFRYGIENKCQNNPEFVLDSKDISNVDYLRGRFTQYLDERHLENDIWDYIKEEK